MVRLTALLTALVMLVASVGIPAPAPVVRKPGPYFPCRDHACGCLTPEMCRTACCCFKPRDAARTEPRCATDTPAGDEGCCGTVATTADDEEVSCCTASAEPDPVPEERTCCSVDAEESTDNGPVGLSFRALTCRGVRLTWSVATISVAPIDDCWRAPGDDMETWSVPRTHRLTSTVLSIDPPPPRS